jgi:hypothetical protein
MKRSPSRKQAVFGPFYLARGAQNTYNVPSEPLKKMKECIYEMP